MIQRGTYVSAIGAILLIVLALIASPQAARAEKRVALIVGNSTYQTVPQLPNPSRDANSVAKMFRDAGFETVDTQLDVGNLEFKRSIRKFEIAADQADIAVIYYAGHGIEIGGTNYLIPIDARQSRWSGWCPPPTARKSCALSFLMHVATIRSRPRCAASARWRAVRCRPA